MQGCYGWKVRIYEIQNEDSYRDSMYGINKDGNSRKSDITIHEL